MKNKTETHYVPSSCFLRWQHGPLLLCIIYKWLWEELNDWPWSLLGGPIRHQFSGLGHHHHHHPPPSTLPTTAAVSQAAAIFTHRTYLPGCSGTITVMSERENESCGISSRFIWRRLEWKPKSSEPHDNQYFLLLLKELKQRQKQRYRVFVALKGFGKAQRWWNLRRL